MRTTILLTLFIFLMITPGWSQPRLISLDGGWKGKRVTDEVADGTQITAADFISPGWMDAVVPGTVLTTLLHNRLIPDPMFGMNNAKIPDVYDAGRDYYTWWFRRDFEIPGLKPGEQVWLNFRGINYSAEIWLNGKRVNTTTHRGMYLRESYLVTSLVRAGKINRLAVWVAPPDPAGYPGHGQGGDGTIARNLTMQFTAGWDWICPIPDRNTGIWDRVSLEISGPVKVKDTYVEPRVPGIRIPGKPQDPAFVRISSTLVNTSGEVVNGIVSAEIDGRKVSLNTSVEPYGKKEVSLKEIELKNPSLWWPNGIGDHPLYPVAVSFTTTQGVLSGEEHCTTGIRETGCSFDPVLRGRVFSINGQKIFIKGGNWIASDAFMRLSPERYEAEIRMHAGLNMNMIRVWGGGLTERPEFYDACDRYGLLVWQDLWISGDCNGEWPDPAKKESQARRKAYPDDHSLFLAAATDQVKMLRNHPSLFLWCGGNETYPPEDILFALQKEILPALDPKRFFLDKSTSPELMRDENGGTGDGPYGILEPEDIFLKRSFPFNPEIGSVGIPNFDGLKKIIPEEEMRVPRTPSGSGSWAYHKYHPFQGFTDRYGPVKNVPDYCLKAQVVSYEQYRALQEAFGARMWDWYTGMLVWKNQNPWTALRGSFYDYYLDYQGGYFGYKHGAAPIHIQLNLNDSTICALNQTPVGSGALTAVISSFDLHGKQLSEEKFPATLPANGVLRLKKYSLPHTDSGISFLRLRLTDQHNVDIDQNFYWLTTKKRSYEGLNQLSRTDLNLSVRPGGEDWYQLEVSNPGNETAFFTRIKVLDEKGELVLPVFLDENYFTLLPGESRNVRLQLSKGLNIPVRGLKVCLEGWNINPSEKKL